MLRHRFKRSRASASADANSSGSAGFRKTGRTLLIYFLSKKTSTPCFGKRPSPRSKLTGGRQSFIFMPASAEEKSTTRTSSMRSTGYDFVQPGHTFIVILPSAVRQMKLLFRMLCICNSHRKGAIRQKAAATRINTVPSAIKSVMAKRIALGIQTNSRDRSETVKLQRNTRSCSGKSFRYAHI